MTTRMLFYVHAVPVNRERHSGCFFDITDSSLPGALVPFADGQISLAGLNVVDGRELRIPQTTGARQSAIHEA